MRTGLVNIEKLSGHKGLTFKRFPTPLVSNWVDVYYGGQRIAIINGMSAPLRWTAKNGSNIPNEVIDYLEKYCREN